jgi:hypothetical protein
MQSLIHNYCETVKLFVPLAHSFDMTTTAVLLLFAQSVLIDTVGCSITATAANAADRTDKVLGAQAICNACKLSRFAFLSDLVVAHDSKDVYRTPCHSGRKSEATEWRASVQGVRQSHHPQKQVLCFAQSTAVENYSYPSLARPVVSSQSESTWLCRRGFGAKTLFSHQAVRQPCRYLGSEQAQIAPRKRVVSFANRYLALSYVQQPQPYQRVFCWEAWLGKVHVTPGDGLAQF